PGVLDRVLERGEPADHLAPAQQHAGAAHLRLGPELVAGHRPAGGTQGLDVGLARADQGEVRAEVVDPTLPPALLHRLAHGRQHVGLPMRPRIVEGVADRRAGLAGALFRLAGEPGPTLQAFPHLLAVEAVDAEAAVEVAAPLPGDAA